MTDEKRMLIVEDQADGGEVIAEILSFHGITADVATSAEAGLELLRHQHYDAALIDLFLPGMDGLAMIQLIRQLPGGEALPTIACTAYHSAKVRRDVLEAGFNAYLSKPVGKDSLMLAVREVLGEG